MNVIASNWNRVAIETLYLGLYDGPHATPPVATEGPIFLGIKNISEDGKLDFSDVRHISEDDFSDWTKRVLPQAGDIVFTYEATLNRYAIIPSGFRGCLGRRLALIRTNPQVIDTKFLYYSFFSEDWRNTIAKNTLPGSTVDRIPLTHFPKFEVWIPPLPTQRKIAAILAAYDDLIENNTRRIALLEQMAQAIYREWFVEYRFPGHEQIHFIPSKLGKIPQGWEMRSFADIVEVLSGGTPKTAVTKYWNGDIPFFTPKDVSSNYYAMTTEKTITEAGLNACNSKLYPTNTIFITARGTVGKVALASTTMAMNQSCYALQAKDNYSHYYLFLLTKQIVNYLKKMSHGAVFDTIVVDTFKKISVVFPHLLTINKFHNIVQPYFEEMLTLQKNINVLRKTRDLLLPRLVSGELEISNLDIR